MSVPVRILVKIFYCFSHANARERTKTYLQVTTAHKFKQVFRKKEKNLLPFYKGLCEFMTRCKTLSPEVQRRAHSLSFLLPIILKKKNILHCRQQRGWGRRSASGWHVPRVVSSQDVEFRPNFNQYFFSHDIRLL